jgi:peptidoglycan/LPS O-acetylase OafA/YrhL
VSSEYLAGCFVYLYYLRNKDAIVKYSPYLDVVVLIFLVVLWFSARLPFSSYFILLSIPLIISFLTQEKSIFSRLLATSFFCYLGRISYALYLVHAIAQRMLHVVAPTGKFTSSPSVERVAVTMGYLFFPILIAAGIYQLVEEPSRLAIRRFFRPKSEVTVAH